MYSFMYDGKPLCYHCNKPAVWINGVDETNCDGVGYIPEILLKKNCLLNNSYPATYRIPSEEETKNMRTFRKNDIKGSLYLLDNQMIMIGTMFDEE